MRVEFTNTLLRCLPSGFRRVNLIGSGHFWGFKILNINILGFFRKMHILGGMEILRIFFWDQSKIELVLGVISMYFTISFKKIFLKI